MCTASSRVHAERSQAGSRREETYRGLRTLGIIGLVALGLLAAPRAAEAQQPVKVPRIGVLSFYAPPALPDWQQRLHQWPFWQGMRELGWREGHNIVIEFRWAEGRLERLPLLATELVQLKVDAILALGGAEINAAQKATDTIPIVMASLDAVGQGFVASLARPGGNVTGLTAMTAELSQKRLELLKEAVPESARIAALQCQGLSGLGGQKRRSRPTRWAFTCNSWRCAIPATMRRHLPPRAARVPRRWSSLPAILTR